MVTSKLFKSMRIWEVILAQLEKYFQYIHLQLLTALQCFLSFMFPTCLRNINQADERKCQNSSAPNRQHQTTVAKTANSPYSVLGKRSCDDNFLQIFCPVFLATITKAHFWLGISYSTWYLIRLTKHEQAILKQVILRFVAAIPISCQFSLHQEHKRSIRCSLHKQLTLHLPLTIVFTSTLFRLLSHQWSFQIFQRLFYFSSCSMFLDWQWTSLLDLA